MRISMLSPLPRSALRRSEALKKAGVTTMGKSLRLSRYYNRVRTSRGASGASLV